MTENSWKKLYHAGMWLRALLTLIFPERRNAHTVAITEPSSLFALVAPVEYTYKSTSIESLLPYANPLVRTFIHEAKYHDNERAARILGTILSEYLTERTSDLTAWHGKSVIIVPIPLSKKRYRERGYNQVERIARYAGEIPVRSVLKRVRDTLPQTTLGKQARLKNMEGAFIAKEPLDAAYTYIVLDDVTTTGATLHAAVTALKAAGAETIIGLALAH